MLIYSFILLILISSKAGKTSKIALNKSEVIVDLVDTKIANTIVPVRNEAVELIQETEEVYILPVKRQQIINELIPNSL